MNKIIASGSNISVYEMRTPEPETAEYTAMGMKGEMYLSPDRLSRALYRGLDGVKNLPSRLDVVFAHEIGHTVYRDFNEQRVVDVYENAYRASEGLPLRGEY